ncbi:MAG TPA: hypothetical protein VNJ12_12520, partial [Candidatus Dormibacteraeota bacterium]|nr:hypothetical protein [Candidatus Dormibacteraeota bacterium]
MLILIFALAPAFALAQGRGRGSGGQSGGQRSTQGPGSPVQMGPGQAQGQMDRARLRTHATGQQRDQFRTATQTMDQVRTQARDMTRLGTGQGFNADRARQTRDRLQEQVQSMQKQQEQLMQRLDEQQRTAIRQRTRDMEQIQQRLTGRLQEMNGELSQANPNGEKVRTLARNIERETNRWQEQYRAMGQELSLSK